MKNSLLIKLKHLIVLFIVPFLSFGQVPDLGVASSFALFTAAGAFSSDGTTLIVGDIGTNVGAFTGFPPGVVNGQIHVADAISAQAAVDADLAYGFLSGVTCGQVLGTPFGNGLMLTPGVYCLGGASDLNGELILDGQCDPDAVFIFKINGALSTSTLASVVLINSASLCNIYWQVNGAVELGVGTVFRGNIVGNGAISFMEGAALYGRGLTRQGAISLHNNLVDMDMQPDASTIVAGGATTFCLGGSVTLTGNCGGEWSNGATTPSITVSTSGNYSVMTSNNCGSATSNVIVVTASAPPVCTITGNLAICTGQSTTLCAPAGAVSYSWNTGSTSNCAIVSTAGDYSVTVTDGAGCSSVCGVTVTMNPLPDCSITGNLLLCETGQTTQLCVPAGATSYLWSNGAVTNCITVGAGTFSVTVTNSNGCSSICSATVVLNPIANCSITGNLLLCEAGQTTQLCVPAGATSYLWSNGAVTNCITVGAGTFSVTVTNSNGCSSICNATVVLNPIVNCSITGNLLLCEVGQTTQLCVPAGATSYLWSNGAVTNCITVGAGTFSVTVTNSNGCSSICSATVVLNPIANCSITGNLLLCEVGQTTELCVPAGATSYLWSNGAVTNCITVGAGTFSVTVTNSNGCSSICSATVVLNPIANCSITGNLLLCEAGQTTQLCVPAGATSYLWSNGAVTNCITVGAGTFSVTVTNSNGCSSICSATVVLNPIANCSITGNLLLCEAGQTTQLCVPAGATSYLWSNGAVTNCITVGAGTFSVTVTNSNGCSSICSATVVLNPIANCSITGNLLLCETGQTTQLCVPAGATSYLWSNGAVTNCITVGAGTFSVTVTNSNGCSSICSATVVLNPIANCSITGNLLLCETGQTTQLCVPAGATSYLWSNGAVTNCITVGAGSFSVTVTNSNGCSSICNATVVLNPIANCSITGNLLLCETGQTTQLCVPSGATSYLWSNGAVTNCITVGAGTFSVTVTNVNGCTNVCSETVLLAITPDCSITGNTFICEVGQTTQLCVPSGAASYLWSNGAVTNCITVGAGTFSVTVTTANGCTNVCSETVVIDLTPVCSITGNTFICEVGQTTQLCVPSGAASYLWSNGAVTNCITVGAGTFSVTVTNSNGCISICSETVVFTPLPCCIITGNCTLICGQPTTLCAPVDCATTYLWCTGATTSCIDVCVAGTYCVTMTNAAGCSTVCCTTVTSSVAYNCQITGACTLPCNGQPTQLCAPAGCLTYLWSTGATTSCIFVNTPGNYCVTVTNANGCTSVCSQFVTSGVAYNCQITGNCTLPCSGQSTQLCAPAGCLSYLWSTGATTSCIFVNTPGNYCVTVTNANGCTTVGSQFVTSNAVFNCQITGDSTLSCDGQPTLLCAPSGCISYLWSTGATTSCIIASLPGNYSVTVTNASGCSSFCEVTVTQAALPLSEITGAGSICAGEPTLLCGPVGCNSYLWSTGATTSCIIVSQPGSYSLTVTNASGCTNSSTRLIDAGLVPICTITGNLQPEQGQSTLLCASVDMATYLWNTGDTTRCITVDSSGYYAVTITNASGCTNTCDTNVAYLLDETTDWAIAAGDNGKVLAQVYPNPFNNEATVEFKNTAANSHVVIDLYKVTGNVIVNLFDGDIEQNKLYKARITSENLSEGVYWCRIVNGSQVINKKIILIR